MTATPRPLVVNRKLLLAMVAEHCGLSLGELRTMGFTDLVDKCLTSTWNDCLAHVRHQLEPLQPTSISGLFTAPDFFSDADRHTPIEEAEHIDRLRADDRNRNPKR